MCKWVRSRDSRRRAETHRGEEEAQEGEEEGEEVGEAVVEGALAKVGDSAESVDLEADWAGSAAAVTGRGERALEVAEDSGSVGEPEASDSESAKEATGWDWAEEVVVAAEGSAYWAGSGSAVEGSGWASAKSGESAADSTDSGQADSGLG